MSVSLVAFRLEIADDQDLVPDFQFTTNWLATAPNYEQKQTYAEVTNWGRGANNFFSEENLRNNRGQRKYRPITLEIFHTSDMEIPGEETKYEHEGLGEDVTRKGTREETVRGKSGQIDSPAAAAEKSSRGTEKPTGQQSSSSKAELKNKTASPEKASVAAAATAEGHQGPSRHKKRPPGAVTVPSQASVDREEAADGSGSRPSSAKARSLSHSPTSLLPTSISFFSGNPSVETTEGILHLYKDDQASSLTEDGHRSELICILAVPASIMSLELLNFVAPVQPYLENIKFVRDGTANQYMVLLKFKSQKYADEFYSNYNHQPFNSIESDICHLVYVSRLETGKTSQGVGLPVSGLTELPVCPVCLERMDESVDGILTILCNHSFHTSCLIRWEDTSCPVCRYIQTPEAVADNKCFGCGAQESLWICLICGHVGCGRYMECHAFRHFQETNHTFAMQLGRDRVWDYAGDNYVHRLVQSKGDGKLVEVDEGGNVVQEEKLDSITLEYTYLLTSQLESQRRYFEEKIEHIEKEAFQQVEEADARSSKSLAEVEKLSHQLSSIQKDKQTSDKKINTLSTRLNKVLHELQDEREMNQSLLTNQAQWQSKIGTLETKLDKKEQDIQELQEQLRDVMFYLEAQQKLANTDTVSQEEIQEGQIVVQSPSASGGKKHRKKPR